MRNPHRPASGLLVATTIAFLLFIWLLGGCTNNQQDPISGSSGGVSPVLSSGTTGNGAPSGPHYNLNIIGVPKTKTADMTNSDGHTIFVPLDGSTKILLSPG